MILTTFRGAGGIACLAIVATLATAGAASAATITTGNFVVYRTGNGTAPAVATNAAAVDLLEYSPAGVLVQTISMPSSGASAFTDTYNATSDGILQVSSDGAYITYAGYRRDAGLSAPDAQSATTTNRVFARLNIATGVVDASTAATVPNQVRGAGSDGTNFWISDSSGSPRYLAYGGTGNGAVLTNSISGSVATRQVSVVDGKLYASITSGNPGSGIYSFSPSLPTTGTGTTVTQMIGGSSFQGFLLADLDAGIAGVDTLYAVDITGNTLNKYSLVSGTWALNNTMPSGGMQNLGGFDWLPGQDLWLRWSDIDHGNNDHGLGIDDLTFSANVAVNVLSVTSGLASSPSTWSDNQAPGAIKNYHVVDGDVVTVDGAFPGDILKVENGTVDINASGSGQSFPLISVETGGNLTESVTGDFTLGTPSSTLRVNRNLTFNGFESGAKFTLAADVTGAGDMNFNSNGAGSELILSRLGGHTGTIRFNGTGDTVRLQGPENFNIIEMNSTGANTITYEPTVGGQLLGSKVVFNQPGALDHASTTDRLQGPLTLVANAPVTVKLDTAFIGSGDERRLLIGDDVGHLEGSANITVNGMLSAPAGGNATKNEFELGETAEPTTISTDTYSGTITGNDYMDFEIRHNVPNAKFIINQNARLEIGNQIVASTKTIKIGAVEVNNLGTLEVGFEQGSATVDGHHAYHLTLTADGSRNGDLTLHDGASTRMQINGSGAGQFDTITAEGTVALDGALDVLVNPVASSGTNPTYAATIGDLFDIIKITAAAPTGDYNHNGSVGSEDYDLWRSTFGNTITAGTDADGNGNGVIDAGDFVVWQKHEGQTSSIVGSVSGTFDALNIVDTNGALAAAGATLQIVYASSTLVQLKVVAVGSATSLTAAVPEPGTIALIGVGVPALLFSRRRRSNA